MQFEFSTLLCEGVAGISVISAAASAAQCFLLQKRIRTLEAHGVAGDPDLAADQQALASRVSSIQSSITVLQSGMSELQETVSNIGARGENSRPAADPIFAESRSPEPDRRKTRFQTEMGPVAPINLNRRGQMMRMHRRGETIPAIASALGISQGEVKLTVRMQELYSDIPEKENSQDRL